MYAAVGSPSAGPAPYYQCSQDGVIPVPKDWSPSGAPVLVISRGERVPILGPTGQAVHSSLVFYRESSGALYFALRPDPAPANTGPESSLMKFLASVPEGKEAFPCAPKGTTEAIKKYKNQFNQTSSSTFYFYLFYLDAAYEELMRVKDLAAKAPKEEIDVSGPLKGLIDMAGKFIPIPGIK
jgi:hypothetical protein